MTVGYCFSKLVLVVTHRASPHQSVKCRKSHHNGTDQARFITSLYLVGCSSYGNELSCTYYGFFGRLLTFLKTIKVVTKNTSLQYLRN